MRSTDVVIIGAGAAGLMCALTAANRGRKVMLIDHANKAGKKILMSGGGRCNFTNMYTPKEVETRDERQKLVFRVKLRLTDPAAVPQAKPGMPGAGYVRTADVDWPANLQ